MVNGCIFAGATTANDTMPKGLRRVLDKGYRAGSLDSAIRSAQINDFGALYANCPNITHVLFNGAAAMRLYGKSAEDDSRKYLRLPSTSPANAAWSFERLANAWRVIIRKQ